MVSKQFYYHILFRIVFIIATIYLFFLSLNYFPNISVLIILSSFVMVQISLLIRYINTMNRKLEHFFIHHLSGEVTTDFKRADKTDVFDGLYRYFNQVNEKLEKARTESEIRNNYFRTIVDHTTVGLISFTPDGKVEMLNDAAKNMFGIHMLKDLSRLDQLKDGMSKMLVQMEPHDKQLLSLIVRNELVQLAVRKGIFKTGDKLLHLVSFQNILHELEQKEIEAWQKLIRVLTHEIMNSITPILSLVNTMSRLFRKKEKGKNIRQEELNKQTIEKTVKGLEIIENRGHGLVHFIQNYRDVTLLPKPVFQFLNLHGLFMHVRGLYEDQIARKQITFKIDCHPSLRIKADAKLLEQVLINMVKNSMEALEGKVNGEISLSAHSEKENVIIEVSDNGHCISKTFMESIFVPFFTTKGSGSGIGLSLSRQIVRLHGGSITAWSDPGKRTVFTIRI